MNAVDRDNWIIVQRKSQQHSRTHVVLPFLDHDGRYVHVICVSLNLVLLVLSNLSDAVFFNRLLLHLDLYTLMHASIRCLFRRVATVADGGVGGGSGCIVTEVLDLMIGRQMNVEMATQCFWRITDEKTKAQLHDGVENLRPNDVNLMKYAREDGGGWWMWHAPGGRRRAQTKQGGVCVRPPPELCCKRSCAP